MKILGTGLTGLLGARIIEVLSDFEFEGVSRSSGVDITDVESLKPHVSEFDGTWVLHMAAKADVDGCEEDRKKGKTGEAWKINVDGTRNVADLCQEYGKKMIYISTDFVFNGEKPEGEAYTEEDKENPINWYGETKFRGEEAIKESGAENVILRIAYPYGKSSALKRDFVRIIADRLKNGQPVKGVTDHTFVPTYIDDIALAIKGVIEKNASGIFHAVGSAPLSPHEAALLIAKDVGMDPTVIGATTREEYFKDKAKRPRNLYLKNDKIGNLNVHFRTFEEGIKETLT